MGKCYYELRKQSARGSASLAADIIRHYSARQHLGKAIVICEHPRVTMGIARKDWVKLTKYAQKQRASTMNADKILKYTHTITHMQTLDFGTKTPSENSDGDIFFLPATNATDVPAHCFTIYLLVPLPEKTLARMITQLPVDALIVDYDQTSAWRQLELQPKKILEQQVNTEWHQIKNFLDLHNISINNLLPRGMFNQNTEVLDDALDTLLAHTTKFLRLACEFQRALALARPLRLEKIERNQYDVIVLLAHRVQALTPGNFTQSFLESYNEDDTFFLKDHGNDWMISGNVDEVIARHIDAGRHNLAAAIKQIV